MELLTLWENLKWGEINNTSNVWYDDSSMYIIYCVCTWIENHALDSPFSPGGPGAPFTPCCPGEPICPFFPESPFKPFSPNFPGKPVMPWPPLEPLLLKNNALFN